MQFSQGCVFRLKIYRFHRRGTFTGSYSLVCGMLSLFMTRAERAEIWPETSGSESLSFIALGAAAASMFGNAR
jgi:hypothetical protein